MFSNLFHLFSFSNRRISFVFRETLMTHLLLYGNAVVKALNQLLGDNSNYQAQLQLNIAAVIRASQATAIDSIDKKLMALQQELIQKANSKEDYDEIADEIFRLRELRQKTTVDTAARDEQIKRINDL